jgi:hypothetical protein
VSAHSLHPPFRHAGFDLNERADMYSAPPLGALGMAFSPGRDAAHHIAACHALVQGGAHAAFGAYPTSLPSGSVASAAAMAVTNLRLDGGDGFEAGRERALNIAFMAGAVMLNDGLLVDAVLRSQLGRDRDSESDGAGHAGFGGSRSSSGSSRGSVGSGSPRDSVGSASPRDSMGSVSPRGGGGAGFVQRGSATTTNPRMLMGSWGWHPERVLERHPEHVPGGKVPASWPGACMLLTALVNGVIQTIEDWYRIRGDEMSYPEDGYAKRAWGPGLVAWMWGRALEAAIAPAARQASWTRRRAAVVAVALGGGRGW